MVKLYNNTEELKALAAIELANLPCLLLGETGTGKTTLVKALAEMKSKTLTRINLNGQTGREELLGKFTLSGGATVWQDGPLLTALKQGHWILLDEINAALPEVLFTIQALTESRDNRLGDILLAENEGEVITPHQDCRIFATANPSDKYVGTKAFNPATLSRFVVLNIQPLPPKEEIKLLQERYPKVDKDIVLKLVKSANILRGMCKKDDIEFFCSTRELVNVCDLITNGLVVAQSLDVGIINKVQNRFELDDIKKVLEKEFTMSVSTTLDDRDAMEKSTTTLMVIQKEMIEKDKIIIAKDNDLKVAHEALAKQELEIKSLQDFKDALSKASSLFGNMSNGQATQPQIIEPAPSDDQDIKSA